MAREELRELRELPRCESHRLLDFERVEIATLESFPPQFILAVSGMKPYRNMKVSLVPLTYVRRPEYWGIEVVGYLSGFGLTAQAPYTASLQLNGLGSTGFLGTRGIEVIGASRSERRDLSIDPQAGDLPRELFNQRWIHSFEEDTEEEELYRPADFDFPPAFGRRGLEIRENGEFILQAIGPADGTVDIPGHWTAAGRDQLSVCLEGRRPFTLTIVSVDDEVLRVRREPGGGP